MPKNKTISAPVKNALFVILGVAIGFALGHMQSDESLNASLFQASIYGDPSYSDCSETCDSGSYDSSYGYDSSDYVDPYMTDSDGDGQMDYDEEMYGTDPNDASDFYVDPYTTDSDGDGQMDYDEEMYGTDPNDASDFYVDPSMTDNDGDGDYASTDPDDNDASVTSYSSMADDTTTTSCMYVPTDTSDGDCCDDTAMIDDDGTCTTQEEYDEMMNETVDESPCATVPTCDLSLSSCSADGECCDDTGMVDDDGTCTTNEEYEDMMNAEMY